jgi:hypothetical protein
MPVLEFKFDLREPPNMNEYTALKNV